LPGIALFYGRHGAASKSVLNVMACVVVICAVVSILWFAIGYSLGVHAGQWLSWGTSSVVSSVRASAGLDYRQGNRQGRGQPHCAQHS
jgi:Amt family ammonium transporter